MPRSWFPPIGGSGGSSGPETDPIAGPEVAAETTRAEAAEAAKASSSALTSETSRATAAEQSAQTAVTGEASRAQAAEAVKADASALTAETSRAQGAETTNATAISTEASRALGAESTEVSRAEAAEAGLAPLSHSHAATGVTVTTSGLAIVTHTNVQAALADLDTWANARPTHESGTLAALPANGARVNGSTYLATDQSGGTTYRMVSGSWVQEAAGVTQASGQMIAGPVNMTSSFDVKAVGTTITDVTGMSLAVPASSRPVLLRAKLETQFNTGTAAANSILKIQANLTDSSNNQVGAPGSATALQGSAASALVWAGQIILEAYLPAPVTATTYKIRALLTSAAPANWTSAFLLPGNGGGTTPTDYFYALAV